MFQLIKKLNVEQRKALSAFFQSLAVAWFVGAFVVPYVSSEFSLLIFLKYIVNIIVNLTLSLLFLYKVDYE